MLAYLHDAVGACTPRHAGLSFEVQRGYYEAVVRATHPAALASPGGVHAAMWASEGQLYHGCALLGAAGLPQASLDALVVELGELSRRGEGEAGAKLARLDACLLRAVLGAAWERARAAGRCCESGEAKEAWRHASSTLRRLAVHVDALLWLLRAADPTASGKAGGKAAPAPAPSATWLALQTVHLLVRETVLVGGGVIAPSTFEAFVAAAEASSLARTALPPLLALMHAAAAVAMEAAKAEAQADGKATREGCVLFSGFALGYLQELVLPLLVPEAEAAAPLCEALVAFVAEAPDGLPPMTRPARTLLLRTLGTRAAELPALEAALGGLPRLGPEGCLVWLQQHEGALLAATQEDGASPPPLSDAEVTSAATLGLDSASATALLQRPDGLSHLAAVGKAKVHVAAFVAALVDLLRWGPQNGADALSLLACHGFARRLLCHTFKPRHVQVHALRLVWRAGGLPLLAKLLALPIAALTWLPIDPSQGATLAVAQPLLDPFRWLLLSATLGAEGLKGSLLERRAAAYKHLDGLVRSCLTFRGSKEELKQRYGAELDKVADLHSLLALTAAAFAQGADAAAGGGAVHLIGTDGEGAKLLRSALGRLLDRPRELCEWVMDGCDGYDATSGCVSAAPPQRQGRNRDASSMASAAAANAAARAAIRRRGAVLRQLAVHAALRAVSLPGSWWEALLLEPQLLAQGYVPTMGADEMAGILAGMQEYVAWYKCPKGHIYTVGNCTRPMEFAKCPTCGAPIGGKNHEDVRGVVRVGTTDEMRDIARSAPDRGLKGYRRDDLNRVELDPISGSRCGPVAVRVIRILMHLLLQVSGASDAGRADRVLQVLPRGDGQASGWCEKAAQEQLAREVAKDWEALQQLYGLDEDELGLALHLVLRAVGEASCVGKRVYPDEASRTAFELNFQHDCVTPVFGGALGAEIRAAQAELSAADRSLAFRRALGGELWDEISAGETGELHNHAALEAARGGVRWLWEPIVESGARLFARDFAMRSANRARFPVLAAVLRHGARLPLIGCAADVLRWHGVLFEALQQEGLRRGEAASLTNAQLVAKLPAPRRAAAAAAMHAFCDAFNRSFGLVPQLYECNANPFLYDGPEGERLVDLSGSGGRTPEPMGPDVPLAFSLPSMMAAGETDASGLCTVRLLTALSDAHNETMERLQAAGSSVLPASAAAAGAAVPTISHRTPHEVVSRLLLSYDPEAHLAPLLAAHRRPAQAEADGMGCFDLAAIEHALVHSVFAHASPLRVHVQLFPYAGELQRTGRLGRLKSRVPQRQLPSAVLDAVLAEVDTQQRLRALLGLVERAVTLLGEMPAAAAAVEAGGGGEGLPHAEMPLAAYARGALLLSEEAWAAVSSPTLQQQVCLCHLQSLSLALEGRGGPEENLAHAYRELLPPELEQRLRTDARLPPQPILALLHDLMAVPGLAEGTWPPDASLKEYLDLSTEEDLDDEAWYVEAFPDELELRHTLAVFQLMRTRTD